MNLDTWNKEETLLLITGYQKHPCLYNPQDDNFHNRITRQKAFVMIMDEIKKIKENVTVSSIKRKIRTLQSQLCKERTRMRNCKKIAGTEEIYQPRLWCFNELSFLRNTTDEEILSTSNLDVSEFLIMSEREDTQDPLGNNNNDLNQNNSPNKRKCTSSMKLQNEAINALRIAKDFIEQQQQKEPTKEEEFCKYLCTLLKEIKRKETFSDLSIEILQLVSHKLKQEKQMMQKENDPTSTSTSNTLDLAMQSTYEDIIVQE